MAKVSARPAPWAQGFKALRKEATSRGYVPDKGWRKADGYDDWKQMPKRTATKRIVNPLTGRSVNVPTTDMQDYWNAYISYTQTGSPDDDVLIFTAERGLDIESGMAAYVEEAFDKRHFHYSIEGCGHIEFLEYNPRRQLMRVTFRGKESGGGGGATVAYFRVRDTVFGELYAHAESKRETTNSFDGKSRHVLGIRFWDLIRIRGSRTGCRYRFTYVTNNTPGRGTPGRKATYHEEANAIINDSAVLSDFDNKERWYDWANDYTEFRGLFDDDAEPDFDNLPEGKINGNEKEQQQQRLHYMYTHATEEQQEAIREAVKGFVEGTMAFDDIAELLSKAKVRAPKPPEHDARYDKTIG